MARRRFSVFNLAFLDVMSCGLGAVVLFYMIINAQVAVRAKDMNVELLAEKDLRRNMPRFSLENYSKNLELLGPFAAMADELGCTPGQLALAWLLNVDDNIVAIPGTTNPGHLAENFHATGIELDPADLARLDELINRHNVSGDRYVPATQAEIDTEQFPGARHS